MDFLANTLFSVVQCEPEITLFGFYHIMVLIVSFTSFWAILHYKPKFDKFEKVAKVSTVLVIALHVILYTWYHFSPENMLLKGLPLYTCRLVMYLYVPGIFFNKEKYLKLAAYWGFYGGIAGLIFPTVFKYPFPHIIQISTVMLHIYIFLVSGYYLFVKHIGATEQDTISCCKVTVALLTFNTILNIFLGTNYTSTFRMPQHLINSGINLPDFLCYPAVVVGYIVVTIFQYWVINKFEGKEITMFQRLNKKQESGM